MAAPEGSFQCTSREGAPPKALSWVESPGSRVQQPLPHAGSGTSKKLAKRNAAAKMLLRVHTVPLDARDGTEAEPDDDHFSIVSGLWGRAAAGGLGPARG